MTMTQLSPAERKSLKARAHFLDPVVLVGDAGLTPAVLREIGVHLTAHELIKVRVAGDDREDRLAIYETICTELGASPVQHIGKMLVLYRPRPPSAKPSGRTPAPDKIARAPGRNSHPRTGKPKPEAARNRDSAARSGGVKQRTAAVKPAVKSAVQSAMKPAAKSKAANPYSPRNPASGTRPPRTARVRASGQRSTKKPHQGN